MLKFLLEFGPLVAFFIGYKLDGIMSATLYMLVASALAIATTYLLERKVNKVNLISTILLLISGSLTLFSGNVMFVKMKPTILYSIFALVFLITGMRQKPAIKYLLGHSLKMKSEELWIRLNFRFMVFFILMAVTNELVWRNCDESTWVNFKVFGAFPITLAFMMLQVPFLMRHAVRNEGS